MRDILGCDSNFTIIVVHLSVSIFQSYYRIKYIVHQSTVSIIKSSIDFNHQSTFYINQLFSSINFLIQSTLFINQLFFSVDFLYQSIFFINGLYMSMDISLSVNWLDSSLAQLIKIFKTFSLVIQHVLLRLKKVTC